MSAPVLDLDAEIHGSALELLTGLGSFDRIHHGTNGDFPDDVWRAVADAGWFATLLPEPLGGLGLGVAELGAIFRAAGRRLVRGPLYDHAAAIPLAAAVAPEAPRERLLEAVEGASTIVLAEGLRPPYGAGAGAVVLGEDGSASGQAELVRFATDADRFVVVGTSGREPILFLVDAASCQVEPVLSHDPCVAYGRVTLSSVPVAETDVIVGGVAAEALLDRIHATLLLMGACEVAGAVSELVEMSVDYAKVREQFGRPIGGFQVIRHMLATMAARSAALRSLCDAAVGDIDRDPAVMVERGRVAAVYATRVGRYVAEESLQVHGGIGFTAEHPLHLYFKRILTLHGFVAEPDDLLVALGRSLLAR